jgi:hypothetical protein
MARRERSSEVQRSALVGVPTGPESLSRYYTLDAGDLAMSSAGRQASTVSAWCARNPE